MTIFEELQSDFCKNLTEFYQISLNNLHYLTDFSPKLMACMCQYGEKEHANPLCSFHKTYPAYVLKNVRKKGSSFQFDLLCFAVTVIEVLPKEKKQKEEKTVVLGQCTVDLLPLVKG